MRLILHILSLAITLEFYALIARVVFEYIQMFSRDWRPRGFVLILAEAVYTVTDPLVKVARRLIPPLRLGAVALDVSVIAIFFVLQVLQWLIHRAAASL